MPEKLNKVDFLLDKAQRTLDELRLRWKENELQDLTQPFENYCDAHGQLSKQLNQMFEES